MICNAKDLSPDREAAIETLLCRRVQEGEAVSVRTVAPVAVPHQISEEEAEDIISEAMRSVRPGYRPHQ
jgi:hypothetical protein